MHLLFILTVHLISRYVQFHDTGMEIVNSFSDSEIGFAV